MSLGYKVYFFSGLEFKDLGRNVLVVFLWLNGRICFFVVIVLGNYGIFLLKLVMKLKIRYFIFLGEL